MGLRKQFWNKIQYHVILNAFQEAFFPPLARAGAAGGTIILAGGPVSWVTVGGAVVIIGAVLGAVYVLDQVFQKSKSQDGQTREYDKALDKLKRECGETLTPGQRDRVHDQITGQDLTSDEVLEVMKQVAGCWGGRQGGSGSRGGRGR